MSVDSLVASAAFLSDFTQGPTNEDEVQRFVFEARNLQQGINLVLALLPVSWRLGRGGSTFLAGEVSDDMQFPDILGEMTKAPLI